MVSLNMQFDSTASGVSPVLHHRPCHRMQKPQARSTYSRTGSTQVLCMLSLVSRLFAYETATVKSS